MEDYKGLKGYENSGVVVSKKQRKIATVHGRYHPDDASRKWSA
jgi:hypothetical protein